MSHYLYLLILIFSICGLSYLDYKYRLALWSNQSMPIKLTLLIVVSLFLIIDLVGVSFGIFQTNPVYVVNLYLSQQLPIEELFFLYLATYNVLILRKVIK